MASLAHILNRSSPGRRRQEAASLVAWIAVVAVIAILLAFTLPTLIRETDLRVAREETALLKTFGNSLQNAIKRHASIPAHTNWAEFVAAEAGFNAAAVATNPRQQPRLLLIDTNGWFNQISLPYTQTWLGSTVVPLNARMMIISSVGAPLPLSAGPLSYAEFANLWSAVEGTANFPTTGVWAGWAGRSDDVKVERVNVSSLFVSLGLDTHASDPDLGQYSVGGDATLRQAPFQNTQYPTNFARYYFHGTVLQLHNSATLGGTLDSRQLLTQDNWFTYQSQVWKSSGGRGSMPGGVDISAVVATFLNAVPNTEAPDNQQQLVVASMMNYMSNYNAWADGGFGDNSLKSYLLDTIQPNMISTFQDLFQGAYYPTNASGPK